MYNLFVCQIKIKTAKCIYYFYQCIHIHRYKIRDVQIQVLVQHIDRPFITAVRIGCIGFSITVFTDIQVGITVYGYQFYHFRVVIDTRNDDRIGVCIIHTSITGINTEQGNVGIAMQNCIVLHFFVHLDITGLKRYSINISQSLFELYIQKDKTRKKSSAYKKYRRHKILFITELIILIPLLVFGFLYVQFEKRLGNIDTVTLQSGDIQVNEEVENNAVLHGYTNIALFGVDSRDGSMDYTNTDTIIIASINNDTKVVKLVSIYRDTYLNIGEDRYGKANAAYANGGYKWAINMLNQNLDLDITDFVTVNMNALVEVVDALGGFDFDLTDEEVVHMNNYCVGTSEITGKSYERIEPEVAGTYHLNGVQAVSYTRIRYTAGNDYKRTERQRELIAKIVAKAKKADMKTLVDIMDNVFPMISTSLSKSDIVSLGMNMLSYQLGDTCGFPFEHRTSDLSGDSEVPVTLSWNVTRLHDYLFGIKDYEPSAGVQERSAHIEEVSGFSKGSAVSKENYTLNGEEAGKDVDDNIPGIQETESETETQTQEAAVSDNGDGSVYDDNSYDQEQYNDYSPDGYNYDEEY